LYRRKLVFESAVDSFGIVEYQVINKPSVELIGIGQEIGKVIDEFFLDAAVEIMDFRNP